MKWRQLRDVDNPPRLILREVLHIAPQEVGGRKGAPREVPRRGTQREVSRIAARGEVTRIAG
jgi:hypothetical protein